MPNVCVELPSLCLPSTPPATMTTTPNLQLQLHELRYAVPVCAKTFRLCQVV
jgi:hypothetical protein